MTYLDVMPCHDAKCDGRRHRLDDDESYEVWRCDTCRRYSYFGDGD